MTHDQIQLDVQEIIARLTAENSQLLQRAVIAEAQRDAVLAKLETEEGDE